MSYLQKTHSAALSTGHNFWFKKPSEIIAMLLAQENIDKRLVFDWDFNSGTITDSTNSDGWLEYVAIFWDYVIAGYTNS